jgi:phage terminase large subunit
MEERTLRFQDTTATQKIFQLRKKIRVVAGGTSASKTISILVWLIDYCQTVPNKLCTVVSESYPHLEKGAMLDFENIMKDRGYWDDTSWHQTRHIYTFPTGSKIEFFSVDTYGKAHGPRRDVLFMNECNNLDFKIADQLMIRTHSIIWMDYNPTSEFWVYSEILPHYDCDFLTLTYLDNEALDQTTVDRIESHKHNKNWWQVYGLGQLGEVEGRIYTGWIIIDSIPHEAKLERGGLDFGFSNDPLALIDIYTYNGGFILDEQLYRKGMHNKPLADFINLGENPNKLIVADSSNPQSIDELRLYGVNVIPATKGQGSVNRGINYVQDQKISMTKRSINLIREYRNYLWKTDKDGNQLTIPEDFDNHAMDAIRYGMEGYIFQAERGKPGVATTIPPYQKPQSFVINEKGEADLFHINIEDIVNRNAREQQRRGYY